MVFLLLQAIPYTLTPQDTHSIYTFSLTRVDHFPQGSCKQLVGENLFNQLGFWSAEFKPRDKPEFRVRHYSIITGSLSQAQN